MKRGEAIILLPTTHSTTPGTDLVNSTFDITTLKMAIFRPLSPFPCFSLTLRQQPGLAFHAREPGGGQPA